MRLSLVVGLTFLATAPAAPTAEKVKLAGRLVVTLDGALIQSKDGLPKPRTALAGFHDTPHPFMIWTRDEAARIRQRVESKPWAKKEYARMLRDDSPLGKTFRELFRYVVMGDRKAGEAQRDYLLKIIGTNPRQFENLDQDGRHFDCYLDALRYDAAHDLLTPEQAKQVEDTFRVYIDYQLGDTKEYTRTSWLPNMQWPRPMAAHLMAVALEDQKLIRTLANGNGGWKWYLDDYISDRYFYNEEFGKQYSMVGEMLLFARGLEWLGLDDLGYGYTGKGGATVRKYLEGILRSRLSTDRPPRRPAALRQGDDGRRQGWLPWWAAFPLPAGDRDRLPG